MNSKDQKIEKRSILDPLIDKVFGSSRSSRNKNQSISKRTESLAGRISNDLTSIVKMTTKIRDVVQKNESGILTKPDVGSDSNKSAMILSNMLSFMQKNREQDTKELETKSSFDEMNLYLKEDRHKEIMDVFVEATKNKRAAQRKMEQESKKRKTTSKKIQEQTKREVEPAKKEAPPTKEAPPVRKEAPPTKEAPPVRKEAPPTKEAPPVRKEAPPTKEAPKPSAEPVQVSPPAKPTAAPAPPVVAPKPPIVKPAITEAAKTAAKISMGGTKGLVLAGLVAAGYSTQAQANIMANVEKESGFNPRSEEVPKPEKIFSMFGPIGVPGGQPEDGKNKVRFKTLQDAKDIVAAGPEAYFNKVYDGRKNLGNTVPGDGYKYRGRGFIQITGRDMYARIGKLIGVDLIGNPDLANTPEIAAKIIPAFFKLKLNEKKWNIGEYEKIEKVNEVVGSADVESRKLRKQLAISYSEQLNSLSTENADIKKNLSGGSSSSPVIIEQNIINNQQKNVNMNSVRREELNPTMRN